MKILFVHGYPFKNGGGGVSVLNFKLANYLITKGYKVKIFSPQIEENFDLVEKKFKKLKNLVLKSDSIILNPSISLRPSIVKTFYYLKKFNKKYIVWFHIILDYKIHSSNYKDYENRLNKLAEILNSDNCQRIICVSRVVAEYLKAIVSEKEKIKIIYPGLEIFPQQKFEKNNDLIFAGRFSEEKNILLLIKAFARVSEKIKNIKLKIVGTGPQEKKIKSLIRKLNLENRIELIPFLSQEKLFEIISQHKLLINPSIIESLSLITLESLFLGTPVIVSKNPGHLEVTQNGKFGLLFNPKDEKDLETKIIFGLKNYNYLKLKTEEAQKVLKSKFNCKRNWEKYEDEILSSVFNSRIYLPKINFATSSVFVL